MVLRMVFRKLSYPDWMMNGEWSSRLVSWLTGERLYGVGEVVQKLSCDSCWEHVGNTTDNWDESEVESFWLSVAERLKPQAPCCWRCGEALGEMPSFSG